jgi:putative DNA primase/helicase
MSTNAEHNWSKIKPCPICKRADSRCRIRDDKASVLCRHVEEGGRPHICSNGETAWFHQLVDAPVSNGEYSRPHAATGKTDAPLPNPADPDVLDAVYNAMLDRLSLSDSHRQSLSKRQLGAEAIERNRYRTMINGRQESLAKELAGEFGRETILLVPGFIEDGHKKLSMSCCPGLLIPVRDEPGRIIRMSNRPDIVKNGAKYLWLSSARFGGPSSGAVPHVPLASHSSGTIGRITEGALKSDISVELDGVPTIGAPGVGVWKACISIAGALGWQTVCAAYDADWHGNKDVAGALYSLGTGITEGGFNLQFATWDEADAKGLDDLLASGKTPTIISGDDADHLMHEAAKVAGRPVAPKPLDLEAIRKQVDDFAKFSGVLDDDEFLRDFARLEKEQPIKAAALRARLGEKFGPKFKVKDFNKALSLFRPQGEPSRGTPDDGLPPFGVTLTDPHWNARRFLAKECDHPEALTLVHHQGEFLLFDGKCYQPYKDAKGDLTASIKETFDDVFQHDLVRHGMKQKSGGDRDSDSDPPVLQQVTTGIVNNAMQALCSETVLAWNESAPCWIKEGAWDDRDPMEIISTQNLLVHIPTLETMPHTPRLFTPYVLSYPWIHDAPLPIRWTRFLNEELWPGDPESVRELQKWFGLLLTLVTSYQKILMLIGPPGSGKGTIVRVLKALIGEHNIATPSMPGLARPFGLWSLVGKSLCVFTDTHTLGSQSDRATALEYLLNISGEDNVNIDRKYQQPITIKLSDRLMIVGNQEPNFREPSGALIRRLIPLKLATSWKGKEDQKLTRKLQEELPGILRHFAVPGLAMLKQDGGFKVPASAQSLLDEMGEMLSPVSGFAEECLDILIDDRRDPSELPLKKDIFSAYDHWCAETKHQAASDNVFGRDLRSAFPHVVDQRPREEDRSRRYRGIELNEAGKKHLAAAYWEMTKRDRPGSGPG